jgi:hypothetical protein
MRIREGMAVAKAKGKQPIAAREMGELTHAGNPGSDASSNA